MVSLQKFTSLQKGARVRINMERYPQLDAQTSERVKTFRGTVLNGPSTDEYGYTVAPVVWDHMPEEWDACSPLDVLPA